MLASFYEQKEIGLRDAIKIWPSDSEICYVKVNQIILRPPTWEIFLVFILSWKVQFQENLQAPNTHWVIMFYIYCKIYTDFIHNITNYKMKINLFKVEMISQSMSDEGMLVYKVCPRFHSIRLRVNETAKIFH